MISFHNSYGSVCMTEGYFSELVSLAAKNSFGVAGMVRHGAADNLKSFIFPDYDDRGVKVKSVDGSLHIELHIQVMFGINIAAIVKSITHKVKYLVEDSTGLAVSKIDVFVDDIIS